jgi:hypothetical protein
MGIAGCEHRSLGHWDLFSEDAIIEMTRASVYLHIRLGNDHEINE